MKIPALLACLLIAQGVAAAPLDRGRLDSSQFAFPKERKEPLTDAGHVRSAIARFRQVKGVSDAERDEAWRRIEAAARRFGVRFPRLDWRAAAEASQGPRT